MPWLSLIPWKIVGFVALILGVWGYGYYGGVNHERNKQLVIAAKSLSKAIETERERSRITLEVERANWEALQKSQTITKTITKVIRDEKPSSNCNLTNGWVRHHNEAATNTIPAAPSLDNANPSGVTADIALEQIAENYGTCQEVRQMVLDCQGWIRQQQEVK